MNIYMRYTRRVTFENIKSLLVLSLIVLALTLSACSQKPSQDKVLVSSDTLSAPLPKALLAIDGTNLVVEVVVDGGPPQTCANLSVDQGNGTYSCKITIPGGSHNISLVFSVSDATFGTVRVATASGIDVDIVPGQTASADFSTVNLSYDDSDNDGIRSLDELSNGTDPAKTATWGTPASGSLGGLANHPSISLDGINVVTLWGEGNTGDAGSSIITRFQANPEAITSGLTTKPHSPASTTTSTGKSIAVWVEKDGPSGSDILCALEKASGSGWQTTPQCNLDDGSGTVMFPQIVPKNNDGSAFVAYEQNDSIQGIFFNGNSWELPPQQISNSGRNLNIGSNGKGTIVVVWREISAGDYMIHATVWTDAIDAGSTADWSTTKLLDTDQTGATLHAGKDAFDPAISVNASGDVLVTWRQEDESDISQPWSNSYDATTGTWASAQQIENAASQNGVFHVRPHLDNNGNYSAVYREYDSTAAVASLYLASGQSSVWAESTQLVPEENKISSPNIIGDGINIRFISWIANDVNNNETFMAKRSIGSVWYTSERADNNSVGDIITDTDMVMDISTGSVDAIWIQTNTDGSPSTILNTFN